LEALQLQIKNVEEELKMLQRTATESGASGDLTAEVDTVNQVMRLQCHLRLLKMRKRAEIERRRLEPFNWDKGKGAPMNEKKFKPVHERRIRLPPQKFSPGTQQRRILWREVRGSGLRVGSMVMNLAL
jgi:hypothetical protein